LYKRSIFTVRPTVCTIFLPLDKYSLIYETPAYTLWENSFITSKNQNQMKNSSFLFTLILFLIACTLMSCQKEESLIVENSNHDLTKQEIQTPESTSLSKKEHPECGIDINVFRSTCIKRGETIEIAYHLDPVFQNTIPGFFLVQWKDSSDEIVNIGSTMLSCVCGDKYTVEIYKGDTFLGQESIEAIGCSGVFHQ